MDLATVMPPKHVGIVMIAADQRDTIFRLSDTKWQKQSKYGGNTIVTKTGVINYCKSIMPALDSIALKRHHGRNDDEMGYTYFYDCDDDCFAHKLGPASKILRAYRDMPRKRQEKRDTIHQELALVPPMRTQSGRLLFPGGLEYQKASRNYHSTRTRTQPRSHI